MTQSQYDSYEMWGSFEKKVNIVKETSNGLDNQCLKGNPEIGYNIDIVIEFKRQIEAVCNDFIQQSRNAKEKI